jgi:hypothetical protein
MDPMPCAAANAWRVVMISSRHRAVLFLLAVLLAPTAGAIADTPPYQLTSATMGASGAGAAAGAFRLRGTLGQPQAIGPMTGATTRHIAGFWARVTAPMGASGLLPPGPVNLLRQNAPNPFNPATTITFSLAREGTATLVIHDVRGSVVATLVDGWLPAGVHTLVWSGFDDHGRRVPSGLYFYSLDVGDFHSVRKMMLLK